MWFRTPCSDRLACIKPVAIMTGLLAVPARIAGRHVHERPDLFLVCGGEHEMFQYVCLNDAHRHLAGRLGLARGIPQPGGGGDRARNVVSRPIPL